MHTRTLKDQRQQRSWSHGLLTAGEKPDALPYCVGGSTAVLLSALAAGKHHGVATDSLVDLLFPSGRPQHWCNLFALHIQQLRRALPIDWELELDSAGVYRLQLQGHGWVDAWVIENEATHQPVPIRSLGRDGSLTLAQPLRRAVLDEARQELLAPTGCADHSDADTAELVALVNEHPLVLVTEAGGVQSQLATLRNIVELRQNTNELVIVGGVSEGVSFGDFAVAVASARWDLLDVSATTERGQVAKAWRHLTSAFEQGPESHIERLVLFDAHLLDELSLALVEQLVDFPVSDIALVICGDSDAARPRWQSLVHNLSELPDVHLPMCALCPADQLGLDQRLAGSSERYELSKAV